LNLRQERETKKAGFETRPFQNVASRFRRQEMTPVTMAAMKTKAAQIIRKFTDRVSSKFSLLLTSCYGC
jgi:hypothetical protein